nr:MAG TPA: hypothetical protein [Caudoviricetes sp.]
MEFVSDWLFKHKIKALLTNLRLLSLNKGVIV